MTIQLQKLPWYRPGVTTPEDWVAIKIGTATVRYLHKNNLKFLVAKPNFVI